MCFHEGKKPRNIFPWKVGGGSSHSQLRGIIFSSSFTQKLDKNQRPYIYNMYISSSYFRFRQTSSSFFPSNQSSPYDLWFQASWDSSYFVVSPCCVVVVVILVNECSSSWLSLVICNWMCRPPLDEYTVL